MPGSVSFDDHVGARVGLVDDHVGAGVGLVDDHVGARVGLVDDHVGARVDRPIGSHRILGDDTVSGDIGIAYVLRPGCLRP